ncbi:oligopeptide transporter protein [Metarhizium robertsii ARSEF 23]|uniref:Oligopeptide transporter protein n=1 Tax=Metarhizium robertsii (strain ARSEF 23 / ATCC MYA-3075) TaxID=655844 RepID=E9F0M6_METRA|nr:oligopeptide transporter protein [Metarhizium robertsii ARSEF 23]EFY98686.1 oligopeptide transporter protein [Metarhizium robertsii ARSEF 23]
MDTLGWGSGIAFSVIFGFMGGYSGHLIWRVYLGVDNYQFPARNYGHLGFRIWGTSMRYITNRLQALWLLLILGQVTIQFGQNISQMSQFKLCHVV